MDLPVCSVETALSWLHVMEQDEDPAEEAEFPVHCKHVVVPDDANFPDVQVLQTVDKLASENVPPGHAEHMVLPLDPENVPAGHSGHFLP